MGFLINFLILALYIIPMYAANPSAMFFGGKTPLDLNKKFFDGKPFFGKGKTFKGTFFGILAGIIATLLLNQVMIFYSISFPANYLYFGVLASIGAILGDIVGSFIKRRLGIESGKESPILDQLDFVIGGMILAFPIYVPELIEIIILIIATLIFHRLANFVAFKLKLKKVPY